MDTEFYVGSTTYCEEWPLFQFELRFFARLSKVRANLCTKARPLKNLSSHLKRQQKNNTNLKAPAMQALYLLALLLCYCKVSCGSPQQIVNSNGFHAADSTIKKYATGRALHPLKTLRTLSVLDCTGTGDCKLVNTMLDTSFRNVNGERLCPLICLCIFPYRYICCGLPYRHIAGHYQRHCNSIRCIQYHIFNKVLWSEGS